MDMHEILHKIREVARAALHVHPEHGHAERLAQTHGALEHIDKLIGEHLGEPADSEEKAEE